MYIHVRMYTFIYEFSLWIFMTIWMNIYIYIHTYTWYIVEVNVQTVVICIYVYLCICGVYTTLVSQTYYCCLYEIMKFSWCVWSRWSQKDIKISVSRKVWEKKLSVRHLNKYYRWKHHYSTSTKIKLLHIIIKDSPLQIMFILVLQGVQVLYKYT